MDFTFPTVLNFDLSDGFSKILRDGEITPTRRYLANMSSQFSDASAVEAALPENPLLYEFYELTDIPEKNGDLYFGTTILYPGKIGDEYYMTKGHFHTILDTAEVYYTLSGHGMMMMETPDGKVSARELLPGDALYVPGTWAHRSINIGDTPLVMFFVFPAHAGHDYGTIEEKGFRKLVICKDGKPEIIDNPKWK